MVLSLNYQASDALNGLELPCAVDGDLEPVTHSDVIEDARHNPASETVYPFIAARSHSPFVQLRIRSSAPQPANEMEALVRCVCMADQPASNEDIKSLLNRSS